MPDIALWPACDHKCTMCSNDADYKYTLKDYHYEAIKTRIDGFLSGDDRNFHRFPDLKDDWTITGGEPTLNPDYFKILQYIREKFPQSTLVQLTHGDRFANIDFMKQIATLENYHLVFPIHGYNKETHEAIVRKKGSWEELLKGIHNALKYKKFNNQTLELRLIIQGQNYKFLDKMYELIYKYFPQVDSVVTIMMEFEGQAIDNIKLTKMNYTQVMGVNEKVFLEYGEKFGVDKFKLYHFPLCTIKEKKLWKYMWRTLPSHEITFTGKCSTCKLSKYCMGIHETYCEFNGKEEIQPFYKKDIDKLKIIENTDNFRFKPIEDVKDSFAGKKTVIFVGYGCNIVCRFCIDLNKRNINRTTKEVLKDILIAKQNGTEILEIIGGEVTIRKDFFVIMKFIKSLHFRHVYLVTNGLKFSDREFSQKLYDMDILDSVVFSIHADNAELHDKLVAVPGAFDKLIKGIQIWQELGFPNESIGTNTAIEKGNFDNVLGIGKFVKKLKCFGSSEFIFADPNVGGVHDNFEELMPKISEASPHMRELLDWGNANGMIYRVRYVPLCHFEDYLEDNISELKEIDIYTNVTHSAPDFYNDDVVEGRKNTGRVRTKKCEGCKLYDKCEGIWTTYYDKLGDSELNPIK
ncbi:radical SAM protein [Candidatus Gracilibacteria bacterium 28_42_T64]|nr:radical SAM protein [Candidatus Gracilibacteria bacterium 28_42_T64]